MVLYGLQQTHSSSYFSLNVLAWRPYIYTESNRRNVEKAIMIGLHIT